ncbi:Peroxisome biogenesis protein 22 [Camellia lanceoleosa]|uniref:Peroxisome biogenesis protein 22 n=1 Tax=Camellia lanceoleosa TaxID=1840588 RepID=A0ACC0FLI7_9ERIC|nr:Peroxisome biogenesis protein 22 [Camellia lanceoleosa]
MGGVLLWVYPLNAEVQALGSCFSSLPFYVFFLWFISALALLICPGRVIVQNEVGECFLRRLGVHSLELLSNGWPTVNVVFCWAAVKWKGAGLHLVWLQLCWSDCEFSPVKPAFIEDLNGSSELVCICLVILCRYGRDTQSIGALAGLAIAIVFTWRLLRSTSAAQRRQPKRQATNPSSSGVVSTHSNANLTFSRDLSSEDSRAQNVIDEFFQPIKPTLGQIVRQKLSEGRKVTCWLLGVVLKETSPEELQVVTFSVNYILCLN